MNKLLFIITGSVAASRCKEIFELIDKKDFQISCILTNEAKKYIKINDIKKFAKNRIYSDKSEIKEKMLHIKLSRINDLIVVCPATANSIAKFAIGLADNLASNTLLASNKKIIFVPAMNSQMWLNKINQANVRKLKDRGYEFIGPESGNLKCGEFGPGRISDTKKIIKILKNQFNQYNKFKNKNCLVTAGPTIEMIDKVRYISNQSSGKQGYEIASQLVLNGANVTLISGPTNLEPPSNINFIKVKSTAEMYNKIKNIKNVDIGFFTAAVSDFRIKKFRDTKIKKNKILNLNLIKNIDILKTVGNNKNKKPKILVGFAAETGSINFAKEKLKNKKCDIVVYNKIDKKNEVFGSNFNKISIITKNKIKNYKRMTKVNCAKQIVEYVYAYQKLNE